MGRKIFIVSAMLCLGFVSAYSQKARELRNIGIAEITVIEEGLNNDVWVGSAAEGVAFYSGTAQTWLYYNSSNTPQFRSDSITSISFGLIGGVQHAFIGTTNGLVYNHGGTWDTLPSASPMRGDRFVTGVALISSDTLWSSTLNGIVAYDTSTLQIVAGYTTANSLAPYNHTNCAERHGYVCPGFAAGTADSGVFYTLNGSSFSKIDTTIADFRLVDNRINVICVDNNCTRRIIGTKGGFSICPVGMACENFTTANGLPEDNVTAISEDCHGMIWIGTADSGIVVYNDSLVLARISMINGLSNNQITSISFAGGDCTGYIAMGDGNIAEVDTTYRVTGIINGLHVVSQQEFEVRVYPQPSGGQLNFLFGDELAEGHVSITDIRGSLLESVAFKNASLVSADVSRLPDGLYFYTLSAAGQQIKAGKVEVLK